MKRIKNIALLFCVFPLFLVAACAPQTQKEGTMPAPPAAEEAPMLTPLPEERLPLNENEEQEEEIEEDVLKRPTTPAEEERTQYLCVSANALNVRSGAGTEYAAVAQVSSGVLLKQGERRGDWYETRYLNKPAYVHANYVKSVTLPCASDKIERVIEAGLNVLGTPYVYGATRLHDGRGNKLKGFRVDAFDCSSLMQYMFYEGAGVLLDVTTRTQVLQGKAVEKNELKRGDLLFFTNASRKNKTGVERIGHVALYLGENYILHTASDYAKIESVSSARWNNYICARRVL